MKTKYLIALPTIALIIIMYLNSYSVPNSQEERHTDKVLLTLKGQYLEFSTKHPSENSEVWIKSKLDNSTIVDGWGRKFQAVTRADETIIRSAGKDGEFGNKDDLEW